MSEKAILEFGMFPDYLMPMYSEFSPVDLTVEGIVKIAQYADGQNDLDSQGRLVFAVFHYGYKNYLNKSLKTVGDVTGYLVKTDRNEGRDNHLK